jgi:hypothetical protein
VRTDCTVDFIFSTFRVKTDLRIKQETSSSQVSSWNALPLSLRCCLQTDVTQQLAAGRCCGRRCKSRSTFLKNRGKTSRRQSVFKTTFEGKPSGMRCDNRYNTSGVSILVSDHMYMGRAGMASMIRYIILCSCEQTQYEYFRVVTASPNTAMYPARNEGLATQLCT